MKILNFIIVTFLGLLSNVSTASILFGQNLSISNQIGYQNLSELRFQVGPNETICAQIVEVESTYLCISNQKLQMNQAFTRMGFFWGSAKGLSAGTLISNQDTLLTKYHQVINGHNLPGSIILNFLKAADVSTDADLRLNKLEQEFAESFVSRSEIQKLEGQFYLIAVAIDKSDDFKNTLDHEIHHARYYLQPRLREAINAFWQNIISEEDKSNIREILGQAYNANNESLMIDEFQAYLLESVTRENPLNSYIGRYRSLLISFLNEKANYQPLELK